MLKERGMNKVRPTISCSICGLFFLTVSMQSLFANDYTYVFTADPGQPTEFNGTIVEIEVTREPGVDLADVFGWNFEDAALPACVTPGSQITPGTSGLLDNYISDADNINWCGDFDGSSASFNFYCENDGVAGQAVVGDYVEGMPQIPIQYAAGSWTSIPDQGNTLILLTVAMATLGAGSPHLPWGNGSPESL